MQKYIIKSYGKSWKGFNYSITTSYFSIRGYLRRMALPYAEIENGFIEDGLLHLSVWLNPLVTEEEKEEFFALVEGWFSRKYIIPKHFTRATRFIPYRPMPKASWWYDK